VKIQTARTSLTAQLRVWYTVGAKVPENSVVFGVVGSPLRQGADSASIHACFGIFLSAGSTAGNGRLLQTGRYLSSAK